MTFYSDKSWVGILSYSFIIFFLRTEGLSGLNLFLDNVHDIPNLFYGD